MTRVREMLCMLAASAAVACGTPQTDIPPPAFRVGF